MPNDKYMERELASVGGTKYRQAYLTRRQAQEATEAAQQKVPPAKKNGTKRGTKQ